MLSFSAPDSQATNATKDLMQSQLATFADITEASLAATRKLVELQFAAARALMSQSVSEMCSLIGVRRTVAPEHPADSSTSQAGVEEQAPQHAEPADQPAESTVMFDADDTSVAQHAALDQAQIVLGAV